MIPLKIMKTGKIVNDVKGQVRTVTQGEGRIEEKVTDLRNKTTTVLRPFLHGPPG